MKKILGSGQKWTGFATLPVLQTVECVTQVTAEEQKLVKHHMIDFVDPRSLHTVVDFKNKALPIVECLLRYEVWWSIGRCGGLVWEVWWSSGRCGGLVG